jgi:hypothetical protein
MQVQVIENRADLAGTVREVAPHKELANQYTVKIDVETVKPVEGMANLMTWAKGLAIDVTVPADDVRKQKMAAGQKITLRVKAAGPGTVVAVPVPVDKK